MLCKVRVAVFGHENQELLNFLVSVEHTIAGEFLDSLNMPDTLTSGQLFYGHKAGMLALRRGVIWVAGHCCLRWVPPCPVWHPPPNDHRAARCPLALPTGQGVHSPRSSEHMA